MIIMLDVFSCSADTDSLADKGRLPFLAEVHQERQDFLGPTFRNCKKISQVMKFMRTVVLLYTCLEIS
uniref:Uncharacterized protein n=1 Tax=Romanomermis culicivorax TaxID=13658 RepID=A0A915K3V0_ROMCU